MSFILYVVVLVVSVTSVMMGLDWLSTPPPPIPKSVQTVKAPARPVAPPTKAASKETPRETAPAKSGSAKSGPKQTAATNGAATPTTAAKRDAAKSALAKSDAGDATAVSTARQPQVAVTAPETAGSAPAGAVDNPQANGSDGTLSIMTNEDGISDATAEAPAPRCDVKACAQRYISFDASDCTYQPYDGPRRLCTVGNPPSQAGKTPADVQTSDASQQPAPSSCNYDACADAYRSFDPATCTWQPFEGPRRLCTK